MYLTMSIMIIAIILLIHTNVFKINMISFLMLKRGLIAPNKFWWEVSDLILEDTTGVELYYSIKKSHPYFYKTNVYGKNMYLVLDVDCINIILDNSPNTFSVGVLKKRFFRPFMNMNVGVLSGDLWKNMRALNEYVLDTNKIHRYYTTFVNRIQTVLVPNNIPTDFTSFLSVAQSLTNSIVFGVFNDECLKSVHKIFPESNQSNVFSLLIKEKDTLTLDLYESSRKCIQKYILDNVDRNSLVDLMGGDGLLELKTDQVYHFVFPMVSAITQFVPRILVLIYTHPSVHLKVNKEIILGQGEGYLHNCIMETFRLNSVVTSLFRHLSTEFTFPNGYRFNKDTEFMLLLNPVLRDPKRFQYPDMYIPERWYDPVLEPSPYNIIFGKGPQKCPGKDLIMLILHKFISRYIILTSGRNINNTPLDVVFMEKNKISYAINPYKIRFKKLINDENL
jgi:Cytochrome P450